MDAMRTATRTAVTEDDHLQPVTVGPKVQVKSINALSPEYCQYLLRGFAGARWVSLKNAAQDSWSTKTLPAQPLLRSPS